MKATFRKNIQLKSGEAYLRLKVPQKREDIQRYLNGEKFEPFINHRIDEYLQKIGVYTENKNLTETGKKVKETGILYTLQEGKYRIWYCENDTFLDSIILCTQRIPPQREEDEKQSEITLNFQKNGIELNAEYVSERDNDSVFEMVNTQVSVTPVNTNSALQVHWQWDDFANNRSYMAFTGTVTQDKNNSIAVYQGAVDLQENLHEFIQNVLPEWNTKTQKMRVRFQDIKNHQLEIQYFIRDKQELRNCYGFEQIQLTEIPLEPYDAMSAQEWSDELIRIHAEQDYLHENQIQSILQNNKKHHFADFNIHVPQSPFQYYVDKFRNKTNNPKQSKAFWHIAAVHDLNLDNNMITNSFTLPKGEKLSFKAIAEKIKQNTSHVAQTLVYSDNYCFAKNEHTKKTCLFLQNWDNNTKKAVLKPESTKIKDNQYQNTLQNHNITLLQHGNSVKEHDRYLFIFGENQVTVWNISNSIDFLEFEPSKPYHADTTGTIRSTVTFNKLKPEQITELVQNIKTLI